MRQGKDQVEQEAEQVLVTVRDWLRYAVSRFRAAGLVYGHGTASALDEAAYLILHTLHLPIDELEPWLEARLLSDERNAVKHIVEQRISSRKPAPYLTNEAWVQGHSFHVDERVIVPRSLIGELLGGDLSQFADDPETVTRVLDLCTGSGCLAILAALAFPNAAIDAVDISGEALAVARRNVDDYELQERISLMQSDLFGALEGRTYDLILCNPPYVTADAVAAFPPEYAAEPKLAHLGGHDGLDLVRRVLAAASAHLSPDGLLVVEVGGGRAILEREYAELAFTWLDTETTEGEVFTLTREALSGAAPA
jgi:ribosomal protein L3 glutamine methyltransferase